MYNPYCLNHSGNGFCDQGCNTPGCGWDGLDCDDPSDESGHVEGTLIIIVLVRPEVFRERVAGFLRDLGQLLNTVLTVKLDGSGHPMIYPWFPSQDDRYMGREKRSVYDDEWGQTILGNRAKRAAEAG